MRIRSRLAMGACACAFALALALVRSRVAAAPSGDPVNDPRLVAAARAEGNVVLYASVSMDDTTALAKRFEAKYGIAVHVLRMESNALPARMVVERSAGNAGADAVLSPTLQMNALKAAAVLARRPVPEERAFIAGTFDRDGAFGGVLINTDTISYNPPLVKAARLSPPRSWADLTRPEWRGKFAIYNHSYEWYLAMKRAIGADAAQRLMRGLAANQPHLVASHQLALDQTADGEYLAAANTFGYDALRRKREGRPIDFVAAEPTIAEVNAVGVTERTAHPNAALLFERWALSRATQQYVVSTLGRSSGRTDVRPDAAVWNPHMRIVISDPSNAGDYRRAAAEFDAIFAS